LFNCGNCNNQSIPGQPVNKIVTDKRLKTYEKKIRRGPDRGLMEPVDGWEIVREIDACPECFISLTGKEPRLAVPKAEKPKVQEDKRGFKKKPWEHQRKNTAPRQDNRPNKPWQNKERKTPVVEVVKPLR
jgi:hypothetical protein